MSPSLGLRGLRRALLGALCGVLAVGLGAACGDSAPGDDAAPAGEMVDGGSWYARQRWPHDGNPIESENFVVYSDSAGLEARREVAETAEDVLAEAIAELGIDPATMFRFPPGQDKIDIYAYHDYDPQDWSGRAYYAGLMIWSPDHEERRNDLGDYASAMQHEIIHVIQMLIMGADEFALDLWFFEGLPEAMSGGTAGGAIRGRDHLNDLTAEYGRTNPISIKDYSQPVSPDVGENYDYPMFQLAVEYLVDAEGRGRSAADARDLMLDVADGASFETAFETRMAMGLRDFEIEFFDLMDGYLPRYRSPVFTPVGFALLAALVIMFVIGALVVGYRRWRPGIATGSIEGRFPGRVARIGFRTEIGTTNAFYNEGNAPDRIRSFWILAGYLVVSVGLLLWAVHRWARRSRLAFLVAPLVVVTSVAAILIVIASF
jgi:hypothetical protein